MRFGRGRGQGYGRGYTSKYGTIYGRGLGRYYARGNSTPYCRWNPALPRGWWRDPNYQHHVSTSTPVTPPTSYVDSDAIDYQINLISDQIRFLEKEIDRLKSLKKRY